jgi:SAM-dependent MidA family methyltransferase
MSLQKILKNQTISFYEYMENCLYHNEYGYYSTKNNVFNKDGDFYTASSISKAFAHCIYNFIYSLGLEDINILELGGGNGFLSQNILDKNKNLIKNYFLYEPNKAMRLLQQKTLKHYDVVFLDKLPVKDKKPIIVIANEVLDAMPVHLYLKKEHMYFEKMVCVGSENSFVLKNVDNIPSQAKDILDRYNNQDYVVSYNPNIVTFLKNLQSISSSVLLLFFDYGYKEYELFNDVRNGQSPRGFYKHLLVNNPLANMAKMDLTYNVNYSSLVKNAIDCGYEFEGYTLQSSFIMELLQDENYDTQEKNAIKQLCFDDSIFNAFKAICFSKNFKANVLGFKRDISHKM